MKDIIKLKGIVFIFIIILFFFPFFDIKCNNQKLYEFTGIELAIGGKTIENDGEVLKTEPNIYASIVLILVFLSFVLSFLNKKISEIITFIFSLISLISMFLLYSDIKRKIYQSNDYNLLELNFLFPYYTILVLLLFYIVFSFYFIKSNKI